MFLLLLNTVHESRLSILLGFLYWLYILWFLSASVRCIKHLWNCHFGTAFSPLNDLGFTSLRSQNIDLSLSHSYLEKKSNCESIWSHCNIRFLSKTCKLVVKDGVLSWCKVFVIFLLLCAVNIRLLNNTFIYFCSIYVYKLCHCIKETHFFYLGSSVSFCWNSWKFVSISQPYHPCFVTVLYVE